MAVLGTFNGASIISFPRSDYGPKSLELGMNDSVSVSRSPYTGVTQTQVWAGGDFWDASIALPQMPAWEAQVWLAFLAELRGMANVFAYGDPLHQQPMGTPAGNPVVAGVNNTMASVLNTKGWKPGVIGLLLPGDQLQLGNRLHRVLDVVTSDSNGLASFRIWPSIREATADGDPIVLDNPQGLWRLADNRRSVLTDETLLSGISFKIVEAR